MSFPGAPSRCSILHIFASAFEFALSASHVVCDCGRRSLPSTLSSNAFACSASARGVARNPKGCDCREAFAAQCLMTKLREETSEIFWVMQAADIAQHSLHCGCIMGIGITQKSEGYVVLCFLLMPSDGQEPIMFLSSCHQVVVKSTACMLFPACSPWWSLGGFESQWFGRCS